MTTKDWAWHGEDERESLVIQPVQAVAVYTNTTGSIVIRQQSTYGDDDSVVVLPRTTVNALIKALRAEVAKKFEPEE